ncbi:YaaL family protein [Clostridium sp. DL1XJH146]
MYKDNITNLINKKISDKEDAEIIIKEIEKVKIELELARNFFDDAKDKNLIDYAIYEEKAARSKYLYLLSIAKEKGIEISGEYLIS